MTKKTTRTRAEAKRLMWEYYRENRETLPERIREYREELIDDIASGFEPEESFVRFVRLGDPVRSIEPASSSGRK